jgi:two-component system, chemotaxis family, response regulator WspF
MKKFAQPCLVAIGSSAGGPPALAILLRGLPRSFPAAIVIVQHIDGRMAAGMAEWLGHQSALPVRTAAEGDQPTAGQVLIAATSDHLVLKSADRLGYTSDPRELVYRPSVDVFFRSVRRRWRAGAVGVLLSGMGRDGAVGLKELRDHGCHTIAQDEASSAVYGMPKAAAAISAAVDVLPMDHIAARLIALCADMQNVKG